MTLYRSPVLLAIAVGLLAFAWLHHIHPPFAITDDGVRDQLLARDCTDLGRCHMVGANASVPGFHHGPVWLHLLVGVRRLGGDTTSQRTVVIALMALSAATLCLVVWRWLRPSIALPATVLYVAALSLDNSPSQLINPSITALPDVVTAASLLCYGLSGRRRFLIVAAFALGAGISVHIGALPLAVPLLALAGLMGGERGWRAGLAPLAIVIATYGITSTAALRANAIALAQPARLSLACATLALLLFLGRRAGRPFRRLRWNARAWIIGLLLIVPFGLAAIWLIVREQHFLSVMYLHPVFAPVAVLAAALIVLPCELGARWYAPLRWAPTAVAGVVACLLLLVPSDGRSTHAGPRSASVWTPADTAAIAAQVAGSGWDHEDLWFRLQSHACRELLIGLSIAAPAPRAAAERPHRSTARAVQVVKTARDEIPRLAMAHALIVLDGPSVAIVREIDSWLQPESLRACRGADGAPPRCMPAHRQVADVIGPERFLFITRAFPEIHSLDVPRPYLASYEIPLAVTAAGTRDVAMIDQATAACRWQIVRADGVRVDTPLPAAHARLHAEAGARGRLVVEKRFGTEPCGAEDGDMRYPPCMFEGVAGDPLLALVTQR